MRAWLRGRVWLPMKAMLQDGLSPEGLARCVAVGLALGTIPLLGTSTALCLGVGLAFRLNQPALQLANYLAYPLQLALLVPFLRLGERLFQAPRLPLDPSALIQVIRTDGWAALGPLGSSLWHAAVAWMLVVPVPAMLLAWILAAVFRRVAGGRRG